MLRLNFIKRYLDEGILTILHAVVLMRTESRRILAKVIAEDP